MADFFESIEELAQPARREPSSSASSSSPELTTSTETRPHLQNASLPEPLTPVPTTSSFLLTTPCSSAASSKRPSPVFSMPGPADAAATGMRFNGSSASSTSVASRLYTNGQRTSRRGSFGSEPELMNFSDSEIHSEINDISSQVSTISKKLNEMEEMQMITNDERSRLKTDNAVLTEDQLQSTEQRWKERLAEEKQRSKELVTRLDRERQLELESAMLKQQVKDQECSGLRKERERLQDEINQLRARNEKLHDDLQEQTTLTEHLEEERIKIEREFRRFREEAKQDLDSSSEMYEELSRQRELERELPRQGSMADQILSLEDELERVRQECRRLREENQDLQAQLLHDQVERGRSLLDDETPSLAEELNGKDSTELLNALREQEVCNQKLRVYINGILSRVIERHPEILEIGDSDKHNGS